MSWLRLGGPVMYIIAGCSFVAWVIIIERLFFFHWMKKKGNEEVVERILENVKFEDDYETLLNVKGKQEVYLLRRYLNSIYIIARILPLLGLLGTVLGMVKVFQQVSLGNIGNPEALASGIWEAFLTTIAGLSCAIPIMLFHSYLSSVAERIGLMIEKKVIEKVVSHEK